MSAPSFHTDAQVAGTESELDTQRKAWGVVRAKRSFKQCFDAWSNMASCGHRLLQMSSFLVFFFSTPNFSRVTGLVNDGLNTLVRLSAMSPPPSWMWWPKVVDVRTSVSVGLITDRHCFASRPEWAWWWTTPLKGRKQLTESVLRERLDRTCFLCDNSVAVVRQFSTSIGATSKIPGSKRATRPAPYWGPAYIRRRHTKSNRPGNLTPWICAPLLKGD